MKSKTEPKTKSKDPNEERFYRFATALMAVPKKELDKELSKDERKKTKTEGHRKT